MPKSLTPPMKLTGFLYAFFAAASWGTVFVVGKFLVSQENTPPATVAFWRFSLSAVLLVLWATAAGRARGLRAIRAQPWRFFFLGLTGGYGMFLAVLLAMEYTTANNAQIIMNSNPVLIVPMALLIGERPSWMNCLGVVIGLVGCALVTHATSAQAAGGGSEHIIGALLALLSGACWAAYTVAGREPVRRYGSLECTAISMMIGTLLLGITCVATGDGFDVGPKSFALTAYLAAVPTVLGFVAWYKALETLPARIVGPFQFLTPVIGIALAALILKERLTFGIIVGAGLTLVGVYFSTHESHKETHEENSV